MQVFPNYCSLKNVFSDNTIYNVPMFQRAYSWEKNNVDQYCQDIEELYQHYKMNSSDDEQHFFGGIVCVKKTNEDPLDDKVAYELVDGQQRLSTTIIFVSRLIENLRRLNLDESKSNTRQMRIKKYRSTFIEFDYEENGNQNSVPRITLSRRDKDFYHQFVVNNNDKYPVSLKSHELIKNSSDFIDRWIKIFFKNKDEDRILSESDVIFRVLSNQCKILMIKMSDVKDAYKLFQVINDRGRSLNSADLLRTASLGIYDSLPDRDEELLIKLEGEWDIISNGTQTAVNNRLIAYYTYKKARALRQAAIFEGFYKEFFSNKEKVKDEIDNLSDGVRLYDSISRGEWPYSNSTISDFQKQKLKTLVVSFKHTHSIPLLMSAVQLKESNFYKVLYFLEKFFFIYKVALEKRMTPVTNLYMKTIESINSDPSKFQVKEFHRELKDILKSRISGSEFENFILRQEYEYKGDNKNLKYMLLSLEENFRFVSSQKVNPFLMQRMAFTGFGELESLSLEHIYPRNAKGGDVDRNLEPVKNKLSNLTLLYKKLNEELSNSKFSQKVPEYNDSNLNITKQLSKSSENCFEIAHYKEREEWLLHSLKKVFFLGAEIQ